MQPRHDRGLATETFDLTLRRVFAGEQEFNRDYITERVARLPDFADASAAEKGEEPVLAEYPFPVRRLLDDIRQHDLALRRCV